MAETITAEALRARLEKGERLSILDVREAEDHREWSIPGAFHCDAYADLSAGRPGAVATFDLLPRDRPVVAVCYAGNSSRLAAQVLRDRGFDAVSLAGGMNAWSAAWNLAEVPLPGSKTRVLQVRRTGKGCLSYLVASGGEAAVIDPSLDAALYAKLAHDHGWTIRHVIETHVHADHLSRARSLAELVGGKLYMPRTTRLAFPHEPLDEGARVPVGDTALVALHTPGHTPESMCYQLEDRLLFTGDTLFLDAIGRPDLEADAAQARTRALMLHHTLARLKGLPQELLVLPAHSSQPAPFDKRPLVATLRQVRDRTPALWLSRDEFVSRLLEHLPPPPANHSAIVRANEQGSAAGLDVASVEVGANRCAVR